MNLSLNGLFTHDMRYRKTAHEKPQADEHVATHIPVVIELQVEKENSKQRRLWQPKAAEKEKCTKENVQERWKIKQKELWNKWEDTNGGSMETMWKAWNDIAEDVLAEVDPHIGRGRGAGKYFGAFLVPIIHNVAKF